jgi:hypothetical protein
VIEATSIGGRRSDFFTAGKLAPGNFGLLQQYRHKCDLRAAPTNVRSWEWNGLNAEVVFGPFMTQGTRWRSSHSGPLHLPKS